MHSLGISPHALIRLFVFIKIGMVELHFFQLCVYVLDSAHGNELNGRIFKCIYYFVFKKKDKKGVVIFQSKEGPCMNGSSVGQLGLNGDTSWGCLHENSNVTCPLKKKRLESIVL